MTEKIWMTLIICLSILYFTVVITTTIEEVFKIIRAGFSAPRKKLISNLSSFKSREELTEIFARLKINMDVRPADLKLEDWRKLYEALAG